MTVTTPTPQAPTPTPGDAERESIGARALRALLTQRIALLAVLIVVVVVWFFVLDAGGYLTASYDFDYMSASLITAVPLAMLGLAELLVILSGRGGIDLLVGVTELDAIVALENSEQGFATEGHGEKAGKLGLREVARFESKGLFGGMAKASQFDDRFVGRQRKAGGDFRFASDGFEAENFGCGRQTASGHLLGVAHQFIEMNFGGSDEGADATPALDKAFVFESRQRVAGGHEADLVHFSKVTLGGDGIARTEVAGVNALADGALNTLVGGDIRTQFGGHATTPRNREPG
jgi:hypothetical protein